MSQSGCSPGVWRCRRRRRGSLQSLGIAPTITRDSRARQYRAKTNFSLTPPSSGSLTVHCTYAGMTRAYEGAAALEDLELPHSSLRRR